MKNIDITVLLTIMAGLGANTMLLYKLAALHELRTYDTEQRYRACLDYWNALYQGKKPECTEADIAKITRFTGSFIDCLVRDNIWTKTCHDFPRQMLLALERCNKSPQQLTLHLNAVQSFLRIKAAPRLE